MIYTQKVTRDGDDLVLTIYEDGKATAKTRRWRGAAKYIKGYTLEGKIALSIPSSSDIEVRRK